MRPTGTALTRAKALIVSCSNHPAGTLLVQPTHTHTATHASQIETHPTHKRAWGHPCPSHVKQTAFPSSTAVPTAASSSSSSSACVGCVGCVRTVSGGSLQGHLAAVVAPSPAVATITAVGGSKRGSRQADAVSEFALMTQECKNTSENLCKDKLGFYSLDRADTVLTAACFKLPVVACCCNPGEARRGGWCRNWHADALVHCECVLLGPASCFAACPKVQSILL